MGVRHCSNVKRIIRYTFIDAMALFCSILEFVPLLFGSISRAWLYRLTACLNLPPLKAVLPSSFILSSFCTIRRYFTPSLKSGSQLRACRKCCKAFSFSPWLYRALPLRTRASGSWLFLRSNDIATFCASPSALGLPIFK